MFRLISVLFLFTIAGFLSNVPRAAAQTSCGAIGPPVQACTITVGMASGSHNPVANPDFARVTRGVPINWKPDASCGFLFVALPKAPQIFADTNNHWFTTNAGSTAGDTAANTAPATKYNLYCSAGGSKGFADPKVIIVSGGKINGGRHRKH